MACDTWSAVGLTFDLEDGTMHDSSMAVVDLGAVAIAAYAALCPDGPAFSKPGTLGRCLAA